MMNVIHVNHSDVIGGAARAAMRLHQGLLEVPGVTSKMLVSVRMSAVENVQGPRTIWGNRWSRGHSRFSRWANLFYRSDNPGNHSPFGWPGQLLSEINQSDADVVHLHWINNGTLSINDISRIRKPVVWTFHDMWPYCGAEHYSEGARWQKGYPTDTRMKHEWGPDVNRFTWLAKRRAWQRPIQVIAPSTWMAQCVRQSALMGDWPVEVIPNLIDERKWSPMNQSEARRILNLPAQGSYVLFGALDAKDPRKGFDLLRGALSSLAVRTSDPEILVLGTGSPSFSDLPLRVTSLGYISDDERLRAAYSAADVFVLPSRQDNLPNTAVEALACGTPVAAFNVGGVPDIVSNGVNGYLARPFDCIDLAECIANALHMSSLREALPEAKLPVSFGFNTVVDSHLALYSQVKATSPKFPVGRV